MSAKRISGPKRNQKRMLICVIDFLQMFLFCMTGFPHNRLHGCVESNIVALLSSQRRNKTSFSKKKMFVELIWKKNNRKPDLGKMCCY